MSLRIGFQQSPAYMIIQGLVGYDTTSTGYALGMTVQELLEQSRWLHVERFREAAYRCEEMSDNYWESFESYNTE